MINLSLNEAIDVAQNRPFWRMMSTFGAMHSYARQKRRRIRTCRPEQWKYWL